MTCDKAKVEAGVQVVQRWVLAALRKRQFFSLAELNEAIGELTGKLNRRPFRKLPGTREELYRNIDLPVLRPLPALSYVFAEWKRARVNIDYHVELEHHYYSAPYQHWTWRENEAMARRLKRSKLDTEPCVEDIDFRHPRGVAIRFEANPQE